MKMCQPFSLDTMQGFRAGEAFALDIIFQNCFTHLYRLSQELVRDQEIAQDIVLETFVKLWKKHADFDSQVNVRAFLYMTTRNSCLSFLRYTKRIPVFKRELTAFMGGQSLFPDQVAALAGLQLFLQEIVETLPATQQEFFRYRLYEKESLQQAAIRMSMPVQETRRLQKSGIAAIRHALLKHDPQQAGLYYLYLLRQLQLCAETTAS